MSKYDFEHHAPREFKNKSKTQVGEDFGDSRFAKVSFKSYLRQVREEETMDDVDTTAYKPGEITELTEEHENQIIREFVEWSGGSYPDEMTDADLQDYATEASPEEFDSDSVLKFIRNYVKED